MKNLSPRQKLFAEYYCGKHFGNVTQAAIAAGYSKNYANTHANDKLLGNSRVQAYIDEINERNAPKELKIATIQEIQAFWSGVMNDDETDMKHRLRAAELLAKAKGAFNNDW